MTKGIIDRFRSRRWPAGVLKRTFADVIYTMGILVVLMLSGLVVGWRVHSSVGDFVLAVLLMLFFTYAMAWSVSSWACSRRRWRPSSSSAS